MRFGFQPDFSKSPTPWTDFEHSGGAAVGIDRAVDPGVAVISGDDPFVGQIAAGHASDDVPEGTEAVVLLEVHLHFRRAGTDVIGEGQRSLPLARRIGAAKMLQDGPGVVIGERSNGNFRQLRRFLRRDALRIGKRGHRSHARRGRITGELEHVSHGTALHARVGAPGSVGIFVAAAPAVIGGVGVDDHSGRAVLLRDENFYAAEVLAVADEHDLAAHVDFQFVEFLKIFGRAVVGIDDLGRRRRRRATCC